MKLLGAAVSIAVLLAHPTSSASLGDRNAFCSSVSNDSKLVSDRIFLAQRFVMLSAASNDLAVRVRSIVEKTKVRNVRPVNCYFAMNEAQTEAESIETELNKTNRRLSTLQMTTAFSPRQPKQNLEKLHRQIDTYTSWCVDLFTKQLSGQDSKTDLRQTRLEQKQEFCKAIEHKHRAELLRAKIAHRAALISGDIFLAKSIPNHISLLQTQLRAYSRSCRLDTSQLQKESQQLKDELERRLQITNARELLSRACGRLQAKHYVNSLKVCNAPDWTNELEQMVHLANRDPEDSK